jgi:hypothetical protein
MFGIHRPTVGTPSARDPTCYLLECRADAVAVHDALPPLPKSRNLLVGRLRDFRGLVFQVPHHPSGRSAIDGDD